MTGLDDKMYITQLQREMEELKRVLAWTTRHNSDLNWTLDNRVNREEELKEVITKHEETIRFLKKKLTTINRERDRDRASRLAELQAKMDQQKQQFLKENKQIRDDKMIKIKDMQISKEEMKKSYENQIMVLNNRFKALNVETENLQKHIASLEPLRVKCSDLNKKLSDKDKALKEETHRRTKLEQSLLEAQRTIESQLKIQNEKCRMPRDNSNLLRQKYVTHNNLNAENIRNLEKQLKEERELRTEAEKGNKPTTRDNRVEDARTISDLKASIAKQHKNVLALKGEVQMYSSTCDKQKEEIAALQEKLAEYKKAYLSKKSENMRLQEVLKNNKERIVHNQVISKSTFDQKNPLPPIIGKPFRQRNVATRK